MKIAALLLPVALSVPAPEQGERLPVHIGGRAVAEGKALRFGWPGTYFEGRFRGTDVTVAFDTRTDFYRVLIDGKVFQTLTKPERTELRVKGLKPGVHTVRLEKLTESQSGGGIFLGFFTSGTPMGAPALRNQIEFIGDSHSVGYGNTSPTRDCKSQQVHDTTDTSAAFGPVLAKRLGADYRVIAYSGYGIVRNYAGKFPGENLPYLYARAIPGEAGAAAPDKGWRPGVIVINLGTNDFSTPVHAGEAWADDAALRADYRVKYIAFVRARQAAQPGARVLLMGAENFYADVAAVAAATGATPVKVPALEMTGCNWHPSLKDHRVMADLLAATLRTPKR
ncbi:SGNH/GDSL hydrolase family protein [Sphingomonas sp. NIBR02145]|uniref:SGNH/GDSL hydrolase family protein n=1 Tax=Sphingomonas sp. NIBR02145 TaxID=3014784 RepID=UPI0022B5AFE7|nr:SGNH/GDSL hydrolase family protein [Sphingomonas sp. NIBR02145]WHU01246.1 SGNH/GDSL hydrolase family protein [Sphingomonas sp. NIBR02145]